MKKSVADFVSELQGRGYEFAPLGSDPPDFNQPVVYVRHDVPSDQLDTGLAIAELHEQMQIPASFHLVWNPSFQTGSLHLPISKFGRLNPVFAAIGMQCDPIAWFLSHERFGGDERRLDEFVQSPGFVGFVEELLSEWRNKGDAGSTLSRIRSGAWDSLIQLDRLFRDTVGAPLSISGRGSLLSGTFSRLRRENPELEQIAPWLSAIDYLVSADIRSLGYGFEATRFQPDMGPGPAVMFGGSDVGDLRQQLLARIEGGLGFVIIFPVQYWPAGRYNDLLSANKAHPTHAAIRPSGSIQAQPVQAQPAIAAQIADAGLLAALPERPYLTNIGDFSRFDPFATNDKDQLAEFAREKLGEPTAASYSRFIRWLAQENYRFGGFDDGPPRFSERIAYIRHDVHIQDLLAGYLLAAIHEQMAVTASFQIMWRFSNYERSADRWFEKLLQFDRRFVQFGLHAAPTATWFINHRLGTYVQQRDNPPYIQQRDAVQSEKFIQWLLELRAAHERDGDEATGLREIRGGTDDVLSDLTKSFRERFGAGKSISGHGNFLTNGFALAARSHPELQVLEPYFNPVAYLSRFGVSRFGFDHEITIFGSDELPFPRILWEATPEHTRRQWYRGRVAAGAGFVALLHPATWTSRQNATFFLPEKDARLELAMAHIVDAVREVWKRSGKNPDDPAVTSNILYNSVECGRRAEKLRGFAKAAFDRALAGQEIADLGAGFGAMALHFAARCDAKQVFAVDRSDAHIDAIRHAAGVAGLDNVTAIHADIQAVSGIDADIAVLNDVVCPAELDPDQIAAACARVVRRNGIVLFRAVNRAHGAESASHRDGTQFLDSDSADRASRFNSRGAISTLHQRPMSPWRLAQLLGRHGFGEFLLRGDAHLTVSPSRLAKLQLTHQASGRTHANEGFQPFFLLGCRKLSEFTQVAPAIDSPVGQIDSDLHSTSDLSAYGSAVNACVEELCAIFGPKISLVAATELIKQYLAGRAVLYRLQSFRGASPEDASGAFSSAITDALGHALVAELTRHADWGDQDFAGADRARFRAVITRCDAVAAENVRLRELPAGLETLDWAAIGTEAAALMTPTGLNSQRMQRIASRQLRSLADDHLLLNRVSLFRRTSDGIAGSIPDEYTAAVIDYLHGLAWDMANVPENTPRPTAVPDLLKLVEQLLQRANGFEAALA